MSQPATKESEALLDLLSKPIAFHPAFVKIAGSVAAGVMLSQAFYWSKNRRAVQREGWFYKSHVEWEEETGLSRREQQTARMHLRTAGLLEEKDGSLPGRGRVLWFRVNRAALFEKLKALVAPDAAALAEPDADDSDAPAPVAASAQGVAPNRPTSAHESARPVAPNRPTSLITSETTPGNTAENTHRRLRAVGAPAGGVCGSAFTPQFRDSYADHFKLEEGWRIRSGTGEYDERIASAIRRNNLFRLAATWGTEADAARVAELAPQPAAAPELVDSDAPPLIRFEIAASYVRSMMQVPNYNVAGYIEQMTNISEETRTSLRREFLEKSAATARTA